MDSPGAAAVLPAAKLGVNETPAANHRRMNGEERRARTTAITLESASRWGAANGPGAPLRWP